MFRNIALILIISIITFFASWLVDLGGSVEIEFLYYKITSSATFFATSLIFLYFLFYLIFNLILKMNNLRMSLGHFVFSNPKRVEKRLKKEQKFFIGRIARVLQEINNKNFSKAITIEKNIKSNFYSEELKSQILVQMNEPNEVINKS